MRILILNIQHYPVVNPNVYRWGAIADYWADQGHEVHILCSKAAKTPKEQRLGKIHVHRTGYSTLLDLLQNLTGVTNRRDLSKNKGLSNTSKIRKVLEKVMNLTWRRIYWPDGSCIWYFPARRKARSLLKKTAFDAVISVGLPFTVHLVGMYLKQSNSKLKWHMDIQDPFCYSKAFYVNNFNLYKAKNYRVEAKAFQAADSISVTVKRAAEKYIQLFSEVEAKISVIPPLFHLNSSEKEENIFEEGLIHLSYFGTFYQKVRSPHSLCLIINDLINKNSSISQKVRFHIFGYIDPAAKAVFEQFSQIKNKLCFHGLVDRKKVSQAIEQTDFLINIGNTTDYHLPSKSVDYLMSGKPILNICQNERDTFKELLKEYPLVLNINYERDNFKEGTFDQVLSFLDQNRGKLVDKSIRRYMVEPYLLKNVAPSYLELLEDKVL